MSKVLNSRLRGFELTTDVQVLNSRLMSEVLNSRLMSQVLEPVLMLKLHRGPLALGARGALLACLALRLQAMKTLSTAAVWVRARVALRLRRALAGFGSAA